MSVTPTPEEKAAATFARIELDRKAARPRREFVREDLRNGFKPEYVAMRYALPLDDVLRAKRVWDAEDEKAKQRAAVARGNAPALRDLQQSEAEASVGGSNAQGARV